MTISLVYKYGLLGPTAGAEAVGSILREAHDLRESIVAIEIARRKAMRAAYRLDPETALLERACIEAGKDIDEVLADLREAKAKRADKTRDSEAIAALRERLRTMKEERTPMLKAWTESRNRARAENPDTCTAIEKAEADARAKTKEALARSCVGVDTRELVERACKQAFADRPLYDYAWPNDPQPREFAGSGQIGLRFTKNFPGGIAAPMVFCEGRARIRVSPDAGSPSVRRNGRTARTGKSKDLRVLRLRLGDTWVEWPMAIHAGRALQKEDKITNVRIIARLVDGRIKWYALVTINRPLPEPSRAPEPYCTVRVGWSTEDDGSLVAATIHGPDGDLVERVVLSNEQPRSDRKKGEERAGVLARMRYARKLRGAADRVFDKARFALISWVRSLGDDAPEWLREGVSTARQWRDHRRLTALVEHWSSHPFAAGERDVPEIYGWMHAGDLQHYGKPANALAAMQAWVLKDMHLFRWARDQRETAERQREWIYRNVAARLAARYRVVRIANQDLRVVAEKRRKMADDKKGVAPDRQHRVEACPSSLRTAIAHAMIKAGGEVHLVEIPGAALRASAPAEKYIAAISAVCEDTARKDEIRIVRAEEKESMWTRLKRQKAERLAKEGSARKEADKAAE